MSLILDFLANGMTIEEIIAEYPQLTKEDIHAAIAYGAEMARERYVEIPVRLWKKQEVNHECCNS